MPNSVPCAPRRRSQSTSATRESPVRAAVSARLAAVRLVPSPRTELVTAITAPPRIPRSARKWRSLCSSIRYCSAALLCGSVIAISLSSMTTSAPPPSIRSRKGVRVPATVFGMLDIGSSFSAGSTR